MGTCQLSLQATGTLSSSLFFCIGQLSPCLGILCFHTVTAFWLAYACSPSNDIYQAPLFSGTSVSLLCRAHMSSAPSLFLLSAGPTSSIADRIISSGPENDTGLEARVTEQSLVARRLSSLGDPANSTWFWYGKTSFYTICSL